MQVQRRQANIVIHRAHQQRDRQVQHRAAHRGAYGLAGFFLPLRSPGKGILVGKALKIGVVPVGIHRAAPLVIFRKVKTLYHTGGEMSMAQKRSV